ncbi:rhodanese-like domain-containing protein [Bordetella parapertussis]|uniref:Transferase n=1 Tax=Bordetella parapertussis (strain Bpp5) TaxID=1208660 RepID=K0M8K4_BORPB|nr:rhodanese-like domain-containing protein [Bordetella parapertussis]CCJ48636.1 Putative transferase [Bordetella parapertussis Bpp5]
MPSIHSIPPTVADMHFINAQTLKSWLHDGAEIALFDVREHGQYGESHLFHGITLPYSRLEADVQRLAPRRQVRLVVYDDGQGIAQAAARRLAALGYGDVHVLEGGTPAWQAAGYALFAGVNVPSKTFGELVEQVYDTPHVTAAELDAMLGAGEDVVVLDGRPYAEYRKMAIPGATNCPNGELAYRVGKLVPSDKTRIVINCAGRTRSIIGAQTLINLGLPNPVAALQSGTQGWMLADLELEHGVSRRYGGPSDDIEAARGAAEALARRYEVPMVDAETVRGWARDGQRTVFLCDVRTPEEYAAGTLAGAQHTPGGQLIQATDQYVGVRRARLVLFDAATLAAWLDEGRPLALVDVGASMRYRQAHIAQSRWSIRPLLAAALAGCAEPVVLVADEPGVAACAAAELAGLGVPARVLAGGLQAWIDAGLPVQSSPDIPPDEACVDYLFFVHDRHSGNKAAARQYLEWEVNLISQLDERELGEFRLPRR